MIQHIVPINDLKEHESQTTCHCNPTIEFVDGDMLVIHNAFDGREAAEIITNPIEILKNEIDKAEHKYRLTDDNYWIGYIQALNFSITLLDQPPKDDLYS